MNLRKLSLAAVVVAAAAFVFAQNGAVWLDVPFVKQSPEGCGAASLAMVMQYWEAKQKAAPGPDSDAGHILEVLHAPQGHGIYASAMEKYLKEHGYQVFGFAGTWNDLENHLQKGRPLIVALKPSSGAKIMHYVVVAGIDPAAGLVMFNDPAGRKLAKLDRKSFEKEWNDAGAWTLLALPQQSER